jgi:hypothetical protein
LIESQDELALDAFASFITGAMDLPDEYAVLVRGERTSTSQSDGISVCDTVYLFGECRRKSNLMRYSATGEKWFAEDRPRDRIWEQRLQRDGRLYRRSLSAFGRSANQQSQNLDVSEEDTVIEHVAPHAYPYFLPFALDFEVRAGRVGDDFGSRTLEKFDLKASKSSETREAVSTLSFGTRNVFITFDPKQGNRPSEVVYMGAEVRHLEGNTKNINAVHKIKWEKKVWKNGISCWVPYHCTKTVSDAVNRREYEIVCSLYWKETGEPSPIPELEQDDWRSPIGEIFEDDFRLDYADWLESR